MNAATNRWVVFLLLAACTFSARGYRVPRGYTDGHFCSACRAIASEVFAVYASVPSSEMVDSGSFRLAESGKQPNRKQVPIRQTELHASAVLEQSCTSIASKYVVFDFKPDVFVSKKEKDKYSLLNATANTNSVRALREVCSGVLDEYYDDIVDRIKSAELDEDDWTGEASELCGAGGILTACRPASDPGTASSVIAVALEKKADDAAYKASVEAEGILKDFTEDNRSATNKDEETASVGEPTEPTSGNPKESGESVSAVRDEEL